VCFNYAKNNTFHIGSFPGVYPTCLFATGYTLRKCNKVNAYAANESTVSLMIEKSSSLGNRGDLEHQGIYTIA